MAVIWSVWLHVQLEKSLPKSIDLAMSILQASTVEVSLVKYCQSVKGCRRIRGGVERGESQERTEEGIQIGGSREYIIHPMVSECHISRSLAWGAGRAVTCQLAMQHRILK